MKSVFLHGLPGIPLIKPGDDVGQLICDCAEEETFVFKRDDIIVVASKIVSKSENKIINLAEVEPSVEAVELAKKTGRDARLCEIYLKESIALLEVKGRMVITKHRLGFECSSAGVDRSNLAPYVESLVVLLPDDPDASARRIRSRIREITSVNIAVVISDSFGRHDRDGSVGIAVGIAGIRHIEERRQSDLFGNLTSNRIALVDETAAAASLIMGQADEKLPVVVVRGVNFSEDNQASIRNILAP